MAMPDVCVGEDVLRCVASPVFSDFWLFRLFVSCLVVVVVVWLVATVVVLEASSRAQIALHCVVQKQLHLLSFCVWLLSLVVLVITRSEATIPFWMVAERGSSSLCLYSQRRVLEVVEEVFVVARL